MIDVARYMRVLLRRHQIPAGENGQKIMFQLVCHSVDNSYLKDH